MNIYCCGCKKEVLATMLTGEYFYPHRPDLFKLNFWKCTKCDCFVGCHKTNNGKQPLGVLATKEMKKMRQDIHKVIDPLWKNKLVNRSFLYKIMSNRLGFKFHTATTKDEYECFRALTFAQEISEILSDYGIDHQKELKASGFIF
tara:strand:+ start:143 stop:577 length:435 start_codon:yes stop_codon:yes gene_type:complete